MREVAARSGITVLELRAGGRRPAWINAARFECYWRLRHELSYSYAKIARLMGLSDRGSVRAGIDRHAYTLERAETVPMSERQQLAFIRRLALAIVDCDLEQTRGETLIAALSEVEIDRALVRRFAEAARRYATRKL